MTETTHKFRDWVEDQSQSTLPFVLSAELREASLSAIRAQDFPSRKDEEWRYTPLHKIIENIPSGVIGTHTGRPGIEQFTDALPDAHLLVFVDGKFSVDLSDDSSIRNEAGLTISLIEDLDSETRLRAETIIRKSKLSDDNIFRYVNQTLARTGLFVEVDQNVEIDTPLHLLFISTRQPSSTFTNPLNLIHLGANSRLKIVQQFTSENETRTLTIPADYLQLDEGSGLDMYKIGLESEKTDHISNSMLRIGEAASLSCHQYLFGSRLTRSNTEVNFSGPGASAFLRGIYLGNNSQHLDTRTFVDHAYPHCLSDQHFRGIMNGQSRGVFNGLVLVREHAQQTDAQQSNKNLLLSRDARVDTKPQLEIFADDVKCAHGATIGELDEDALFYLQSRGISRRDAKQMLTRAFAAEITEEIKIQSLKEFVQKNIETRLMETPQQHV